MDRRRFLLTSLAGALAAPLAAEAEQAAQAVRIGWLGENRVGGGSSLREYFLQGLRDLGYVEGLNFVMEGRYTEGKVERYRALAAELVALKVDVLVAANTLAAVAAKEATRTAPIVFTGSSDPVGSGLVASLARPGGNVTGSSFFVPGLVGKCMELLKQAVPRTSRVAVLWDPAQLLEQQAKD